MKETSEKLENILTIRKAIFAGQRAWMRVTQTLRWICLNFKLCYSCCFFSNCTYVKYTFIASHLIVKHLQTFRSCFCFFSVPKKIEKIREFFVFELLWHANIDNTPRHRHGRRPTKKQQHRKCVRFFFINDTQRVRKGIWSRHRKFYAKYL